jgi:hypothetical protein
MKKCTLPTNNLFQNLRAMAAHTSNDGETLNGDPPSRSVPSEKEDATPKVNEDEFPHGIKLFLLTLALGLSVFLVALVSFCSPLYTEKKN